MPTKNGWYKALLNSDKYYYPFPDKTIIAFVEYDKDRHKWFAYIPLCEYGLPLDYFLEWYDEIVIRESEQE